MQDIERPYFSCSGDENVVTYKTKPFSVEKATVIFYTSDPNRGIHCLVSENANFTERDFWVSYMSNQSQAPGSPKHMYTTVYLNLYHDHAEGIDFLFEGDTGFKYKYIDNVLFMWLDTFGLSMILPNVSKKQYAIE